MALLVSALRRFPSPRSPLPAHPAGTSYLHGPPRPRVDHGLAAGEHVAPQSGGSPATGHTFEGADPMHTPPDPRFRINAPAIPGSRRYARLHMCATFQGHGVVGSFRWQATDAPSRVPPSPCTRPRPPPGPRPFELSPERAHPTRRRFIPFVHCGTRSLPNDHAVTVDFGTGRLTFDDRRGRRRSASGPVQSRTRGERTWTLPSRRAWATGR